MTRHAVMLSSDATRLTFMILPILYIFAAFAIKSAII